MTPPPEFEAHLDDVVRAITMGRLIAFLGAGANLCARPEGAQWHPGQKELLPLGGELASHLAQTFGFSAESAQDLSRVSQHVALLSGTGPLYDELHALLDADYPATPLHHLFARLPALLRDKGYPRAADSSRRRLLVVTTNYDDLMERAFREIAEPFHGVVYEADGDHKGKFFHWFPERTEPVRIDQPNEYKGLLADEHPIILKIHGAVDRQRGERDSFVITEDHYIEYLARTDIPSLIPAPLPGMLRQRHLLFLGYSLKDWNLRVILHRLWGDRKLTWKSWAIQLCSDPLDREFWRRRDVDILDRPLGEYISWLEERISALPPAGAAR